jgi:very-short-patch-repair endonuclease
MMTKRAQRLRRHATDAENQLWHAVRRSRIGGLSFRRQHPIGAYVIDFYCSAVGLAIEVDGGQHNTEIGRARDERRTRWLASKGITILRFWNNDVFSNFDGVLSEIVRSVEALRSRRATPSLTLPLSGGGEVSGAR